MLIYNINGFQEDFAISYQKFNILVERLIKNMFMFFSFHGLLHSNVYEFEFIRPRYAGKFSITRKVYKSVHDRFRRIRYFV